VVDIKKRTSTKIVCAAPWVEGVLRADGNLLICCRNSTSLGNWQKSGLASLYNNDLIQNFRQRITNEIIHDKMCETCISNGTIRTIYSELFPPYKSILIKISPYIESNYMNELRAFAPVLANNEYSLHVAEKIAHIRTIVADMIKEKESIELYLKKILIILNIAESYYKRKPIVSEIIPFRQVSLKAQCNARCIQCPGIYTGSVVNGLDMPEEFIEEAFSHPADMINFFMNGSEFLYVNGWKDIASTLKQNAVELGISTNGILLTPANIRYIIDNELSRNINISLDGAIKETVGSIRVNVNYDKLLKSIEFLFNYAEKKCYELNVSFSFVLMKRNYKEFPDMIDLISRLRQKACSQSSKTFYTELFFNCQSLEGMSNEAYNSFLSKEHISLANRTELVSMFNKCRMLKDEHNVSINILYSYSIDKFLEYNYPIPPMPERVN